MGITHNIYIIAQNTKKTISKKTLAIIGKVGYNYNCIKKLLEEWEQIPLF